MIDRKKTTNIAFVGCGYVFDIYMRTYWAHREMHICGVFDIDSARLRRVTSHYGLRAYGSYSELLGDSQVTTVINLTSIGSHFETTLQALDAGKHVYSEKPFSLELEQTKSLFNRAMQRGVVLTGAPCNLFSDAICTIWKAVKDGAIGKPLLVYAELDDNPAHLMELEKIQSPTGAPFPYAEELQEGCTIEHAGYHLAWLCAMFGPVVSLTSFSKCLVERKTATPLRPPDTADFSVACLRFSGGVVARVTCSWVAPRDHSFKVVGDLGELTADNVFHDQTHVRLERFSRLSLSARKLYTARAHRIVGRLFGIGGQRLPLIRRWKSHAVEAERGVGQSIKHRFVSWLRRREVYAQDKFLGIAEMTRAIDSGGVQPMPPEFQIHVNELTLLIHRSGPYGACQIPTTSFVDIQPTDDVLMGQRNYEKSYRPTLAARIFSGVVESLHRR